MSNKDLLGHWPLATDSRDVSGNGWHGNAADVVFRDGAAQFDGESSRIAIGAAAGVPFVQSPFTFACHIRPANPTHGFMGDLAAQFAPTRRHGMTLSLLNYAGVASNAPNHMNLAFGLDASCAPKWRDCGRPGEAVMVWALTVFDGALYAGTFESGRGQAGHVYRYAGGSTWEDCGTPGPSNAITSLCVFDGELYAASSHYRSGGSSLPDAENTVPGGRVYRYDGGQTWTDCGQLRGVEAIYGLIGFEGKLYASSMYSPGLYRYEGDQRWLYCGHPGGRIAALTAWRGVLYGSGYDADNAGVYRYDGDAEWSDCGTPPDTTQTYSFMSYRGELYVGTWPGGRVYRYGAGTTWHDAGRLGEETEVMGMAVYNGSLYGGTLPLAEVHRYAGGTAWERVGRVDHTPGVRYRRAWTMAAYEGELFVGTLPSGQVHAMRCGAMATVDRALPSGTVHVAAVRTEAQLFVYVNGVQAAASNIADPSLNTCAPSVPLELGVGPHDWFRGAMGSVRLYARALAPSEVAALAG